MNVGIIGLPQTGKKTLFRLLAGEGALPPHLEPRAVVRGVAEVLDPRLDRLFEIFRPRKETRARLDFVLLPKIEEHAVSQGDVFRDMGEIDAFVHVVRAFADASVYHVWGAPDPAREVEYAHTELVLHDHLFVEKRLERLESDLKKFKDERRLKERELLLRLRAHLEEEKPLRLCEISEAEEAMIASYPLLTRCETIVALNVSDEQAGDAALARDLEARFGAKLGLSFVEIPMRLEAEIAQLDSEDEREAFMAEMGIEDTALHLLTARCIEALGLISFFTVAPIEVRHWFVKRGSLAPRAAGVVHSDLERGFIRAEVMHYEDIDALGSEEKVKAAGKYHVKGKDYVVQDGDMLFIRFSV